MIEAEGKFLHVSAGMAYFARVTIQIEADPTGPQILFRCVGKGFTSQGCIEEATPSGYIDWKVGGEAGVRYALKLANKEQSRVHITQILGLTSDTNPAAVGAAAMRAVWQTLNYTPLPSEAERIKQIVSASWQYPDDYVPDFSSEA